MAFLFHQDGLVSPLQQMPGPVTAAVEGLGVYPRSVAACLGRGWLGESPPADGGGSTVGMGDPVIAVPPPRQAPPGTTAGPCHLGRCPGGRCPGW